MTDTPTSTTESNDTTDDETETTAPPADAEGPDPAVVDALRDAATPLSTTDPDAPLEDLAAFGDSVAGAEIVALGEATHGTREFFDLKARLIRYCVEELGTRTIGFEANAGEALAVDEYVVHGEGDPREAIEGLYFWTWAVESVLDLVEWLRAFNEDRPLDDRVRFYGIDAQYTRGPVDRLQAYLDRVDPAFADEVRADLETIADDGGPPMADDAVVSRLAAADRCLRRVRDRLAARRAAYVEATGERAHALARRHVETIDQALAYRATSIDADEEDLFGGGDAVSEVMLRRREGPLADGVDWIHARDRGDGPVVCWAHDAHVAAADQHAGGATSPAMGAHLRERHGDDYRPLGFTFGAGDLRAIGEVETEGTTRELRTWSFDGPLPGTVDAAVAATGHDLALVDLRRATDDRLREWAATERPHHSIGATYDADDPADHTKPYAPGEAFDLLVHVAETTPSRPFDED